MLSAKHTASDLKITDLSGSNISRLKAMWFCAAAFVPLCLSWPLVFTRTLPLSRPVLGVLVIGFIFSMVCLAVLCLRPPVASILFKPARKQDEWERQLKGRAYSFSYPVMTTGLLILLFGGVFLGPVPTGSETPGGFNVSLLSYWVGVFLLSLSQLLPSYYVIWHIKALPADSLDKGAGFDWTERLLWGGFVLVITYLLINLALIFFS